MTKRIAILNLTPDSFSTTADEASQPLSERLEAFASAGAAMVDVGAESTRPGATPLSAEEEWQRILPHLPDLLAAQRRLEISLDTRHPENALRAIAAGISIINDVSGLPPAMAKTLAPYPHVQLVAMHHLGLPANPSTTLPVGEDPLPHLARWALALRQRLEEYAIAPERVSLDPGIGFGKTLEQNWQLLRAIPQLKQLGFPLWVGHSRKSFFRCLWDVPAQDRDSETAMLSLLLERDGVDAIRIHNPMFHKNFPITIASTAEDWADIHQLMLRYRDEELTEDYWIGGCGLDEELPNLSQHYSPPHGMFLLAREAGKAVGCVAFHHRSNAAEIKRMYVIPSARGRGLAAMLMCAITVCAKWRGADMLLLDSLKRFTQAHALYGKLGFQPCEPYCPSTTPAMREQMVFMQKTV